MRFLAIDFGRRRLGLAVCDPDETLATPYASRERRGTRHDVADLVRTVRGLGIEGIVFGLPRSLESQPLNIEANRNQTGGEPGRQEDTLALARKFAAALQEALHEAGLPLDIAWWDERFSTSEALKQMRALGISQRSAREAGGGDSTDARAAANILQGFLDSRRNTNQRDQADNAPDP